MLAFQDCQVHICTNNCKLFCSNGCYDVQIPEVNDSELLRYLSFHFFLSIAVLDKMKLTV